MSERRRKERCSRHTRSTHHHTIHLLSSPLGKHASATQHRQFRADTSKHQPMPTLFINKPEKQKTSATLSDSHHWLHPRNYNATTAAPESPQKRHCLQPPSAADSHTQSHRSSRFNSLSTRQIVTGVRFCHPVEAGHLHIPSVLSAPRNPPTPHPLYPNARANRRCAVRFSCTCWKLASNQVFFQCFFYAFWGQMVWFHLKSDPELF